MGPISAVIVMVAELTSLSADQSIAVSWPTHPQAEEIAGLGATSADRNIVASQCLIVESILVSADALATQGDHRDSAKPTADQNFVNR